MNKDIKGDTNGNSLGTFEVSVKFARNSTWQGQIHWVEEGKKQNFRSALEMLKLIDGAINNEEEDPKAKWQLETGTAAQ